MFFDSLEDEVEYYKTEYFYGFTTSHYNIIVFVENYDDEPFWRFILRNVNNDKFKPAFIHLDGKKNILKYLDYFDSEFIGCIDSDYDYILEKEYLNNEYLFHTYVYSLESYSVCAKTLNNIFNDLNINSDFDFQSFFGELSTVVEKVLLHDIWLFANKVESVRDVLKFNSLREEDITKDKIISIIKEKIDSLGLDFCDENVAIYKNRIIQNELIKEDFLHLYIEGHIIYDSVLNLAEKIAIKDFKKKLEVLKNNTELTGAEIKQKINELKNKQLDVHTALKLNFKECFYHNHCNSLQQIITDINNSLCRDVS